MKILSLFCCILTFCRVCMSKSLHGTFTTFQAQREKGQYLSSFCFHGEAIIQFKLNTTGNSPAKLYLFLNDDWPEALEEPDCDKKLEKARAIYELTTEVGNRSVAHFKYPRIWHVLIADTLTCSGPILTEKLNFIEYDIQLYNPDALGNPREHFSDEETGLLRFYQLLSLAYFILGCICIPRLWEPLTSSGPMQLVIQLLSVSTCLQAVAAFILMLHLRKYSKDGVGAPLIELLSELFDVLSQFAMLYMLLSLSLGWTLGTSYRNTHLQMISKKPAAKVVAVLGILQGVLFLWEQYQDQTHKLYHAHRSYAGRALVILRVALAGLFGWNLYTTVSSERSLMKREFYISFTKCCMLWFLCYPVIVIVTWLFSEYLRYKLVTMGVVLCQSAAVVMLYKLFLSRSLYWEVSTLSSTLPIRFDRTMSLKIYS